MRSLRGRLLAWTLGGMALLLAVFAVGVYAAIHRSLTAGFNDSLVATARALAASVKQEDDQVEVEFDDRDMPEFRRPKRPDYFQVWQGDGKVLRRSPSLGDGDLGPFAGPGGDLGGPVFEDLVLPTGRPGRAAVLMFAPKVDPEEEEKARKQGKEIVRAPPVTLAVARETEALQKELARIAWLLAGAAAGTIALALGVGGLVVRQGLRPLDVLAARIAAIREDRLSQTVPVEGMPAEMVPVGRRLNDLLRRLQEAFQRERAFTADAAHELRTPLAGLRSTLEVDLSRARTPAEYRQSLADNLAIVRQMQDMVDSLLALARLESGQVTLRPEAVRLAEALDVHWRPLAGKARARGIAFETRVPADLACTADRDHLAIVLSNLLANAAVYTDDGGRIQISGRPDGDRVELAMSNTGCRLSPEQAGHIFERFWRGDAARAGTGIHCGLGLALVQRTVSALGGDVTVHVAGGVFTVRLVLPGAVRRPPL